jgi:hypothetical protein
MDLAEEPSPSAEAAAGQGGHILAEYQKPVTSSPDIHGPGPLCRGVVPPA